MRVYHTNKTKNVQIARYILGLF